MEPITHLLTGACLGRSGFNRRSAYATLAMTLAAEAPDLDMLWRLRGPVAEFEHHRGWTHTLLGAPIVALAATAVCWGFHRLRRRPPPTAPHWVTLWACALVAALSHILLDFTNSYGVRPLFPFRPTWYHWDIVFLFEPVLFAFLLAGLLAPAILGLVDREISRRRPVFRGRGWAVFALAGMVALWTLRSLEHATALTLLRQTSLDRPALRVAAEPYPLNPFRWQGIVETDNAYHLAAVDVRARTVDTEQPDSAVYKAAVTPAVSAAKRSRTGRVYLGWAQFPLVEDVGPGTPPGMEAEPGLRLEQVDFHDMRFSYGDWFGLRPGSALAATVYVAPNGEAEASSMGGRPQN